MLHKTQKLISSTIFTYPSLSIFLKKMAKTYNSGYSPVVTHLTTNPPVSCLNIAEQTGSIVLKILWSYVTELCVLGNMKFCVPPSIHSPLFRHHKSRQWHPRPSLYHRPGEIEDVVRADPHETVHSWQTVPKCKIRCDRPDTHTYSLEWNNWTPETGHSLYWDIVSDFISTSPSDLNGLHQFSASLMLSSPCLPGKWLIYNGGF